VKVNVRRLKKTAIAHDWWTPDLKVYVPLPCGYDTSCPPGSQEVSATHRSLSSGMSLPFRTSPRTIKRFVCVAFRRSRWNALVEMVQKNASLKADNRHAHPIVQERQDRNHLNPEFTAAVTQPRRRQCRWSPEDRRCRNTNRPLCRRSISTQTANDGERIRPDSLRQQCFQFLFEFLHPSRQLGDRLVPLRYHLIPRIGAGTLC